MATHRRWASVPSWFFAVIGVVAILTPILWDKHKSRASLELQHLATSTIVEKSPSLKKLRVLYENVPVERLTFRRFALTNTGSRPILESDVRSPVTIKFPNTVQILEARVETATPENLSCAMNVDTSAVSVSIPFDLMNAGDRIEFSVLLAGPACGYSADARIVGVRWLGNVDREPELKQARRKFGGWFYATSAFTLVSALGVIGVGGLLRKENRLRREMEKERVFLGTMHTKADFRFYIKKELDYAKDSDVRTIIGLIDTCPNERLSEDEERNIRLAILSCIARRHDNMPIVIVAGILMTAGIIYILVSVV